MPKSRYAARVDDNHAEIRETFRALGYSVHDTATAGQGYPDMTIGKDGINLLIEVKDGSKTPSQRKLTKPQVKFFDEWKGQVCVVKSVEEAINLDRKLFKEND